MPRSRSKADVSAADRIVRQSRTAARLYAVLAALGLLGLLVDRSWISIAGAIIPLQIALTEWALGHRFAARPTPDVGQWFLWHQLWIVVLGMGVLAVLFDWPLDAIWSQVPPELRRSLETPAAMLETTPLGALQLAWRATIIVSAALFSLKIGLMSWRYARWIRQLPT